MANVLIHYFSGTGNSARVAAVAGETFQELGFKTELRSISKGRLLYSSNYDFHVFTFPTYSFIMPALMHRYLKHLPPGRGAKTMVLAIYGVPGYEGRTLHDATRILRRRGYDVTLAESIGCPESFTQVSNPPQIDEQKRLNDYAALKVAAFVDQFIAGEPGIKPCGLFNRIWTGLIGFAFTTIGRRCFGKLYVADETCNLCGECARTCPTGTIRIMGRPRWNYRCQACQRCINLCPRAAIQTSCVRMGVVLAAMVLSLIWVHTWVYGPAGPVQNPVLQLLILLIGWLVGQIALFYIADKFLFLLELIPGVRKGFNWSYTKGFRRYLEPHFHPERRA